MLEKYLDLKQIIRKTILKYFFGKKNMCNIFLKIKMQEPTCRELLEYFVNCHVDARSKILHARSKLEKSQTVRNSQHNELLSIGNMKHSETLTLRKMKVKTSQMEA